MRRSLVAAFGIALIPLVAASAVSAEALDATGSTLRGSRSSMTRQNAVARANDYTFLRTSGQVRAFVDEGYLVPIRGNGDYRLAGVSHPVARPIIKTLVERLGRDYHEACGDRLVVTSLTRPLSEQPRNASDLSVHPAGMAIDLRIPARSRCRTWLESTLLSMERRGLLDVTRERNPPHYHVAVFPDAYGAYVGEALVAEAAEAAAAAREQATADAALLAELTKPVNPPVAHAGVGRSTGPGVAETILFLIAAIAGGAAIMLRGAERAAQGADSTER